jgi:FemAB-related protein (PEP-CTERM system-associated)
MSTTISIAKDSDAKAWQRFLESSKVDHHAFDWGWRKIVQDVFSHKAFYLIARENGQEDLTGVLPLFLVQSFLFGRSLISVPYLNGGGPIAGEESTRNKLVESARELAREHKVKYLELRAREDLQFSPDSFEVRTHKAAMKLSLLADPEEMFGQFPAKLRSQIRRPSKSGVAASVIRGDRASKSDINTFYRVFAENMRDLGTPVYPKSVFSKAVFGFGKDANIILVKQNKQVLASGITIKKGECVEIPWASSLRKYNKLSPNMLLYWEAIKTACTDGAAYFDFGRSTPDSGTYRFKKQWGAEPQLLHWYYDNELEHIPNVNPQSSSFAPLVTCWRHLPMPIANTLGPILTRSIP